MARNFKNPIVNINLRGTVEGHRLGIETATFEVLMLNVNRSTMRGRILDVDGGVLYSNVDLSMSMIVDDTITITRE